jgi:ATP-dependent protease ClpP protease subunit
LSEICALRTENNDPITIRINSIGGSVLVLKYINGLLDSSDLDGKFVRTVTIASGTAASAGAILMAFGDYAYAYEHSFILFHGVRGSELPEKFEDAAQLLGELDRTQREVSRKLSQVVIRRVAYRYQKLKEKFNLRRRDIKDRELVELRCFVDEIKQEISGRARALAERTFRNVEQARFLNKKIVPPNLAPRGSLVRQDAKVLTRVIQHEIKEGRPKLWRLDESGIQRILSDYFTIRDYNLGEHNEFLGVLMNNIGFDFLTPAEGRRYNKIKSKDEKKARQFLWEKALPSLEPLWFYTVSLCRLLFEGENRLTPEDAYWLGIIDEVIGTKLVGFRVVAEQKQKTQPANPASTTAPAPPPAQSALSAAPTAKQP